MDIGALIIQFGYPVLFLFTLLEGETAVALSGFAAHQGYLELHWVIMIAIVGASLGDQAFFLFGRWKGKKLLLRHPELAGKVHRVHLLLSRYRDIFVFGSRFVYGFRMVIPVAMGLSDLSYKRFAFFNILGAIVWGVLFAVLGYLFGGAIEIFLGKIKHYEGWIFLAVLLLGVLLHQGFKRIEKRALSCEDEDQGLCR